MLNLAEMVGNGVYDVNDVASDVGVQRSIISFFPINLFIIALSISIAHFHCFHWTKSLTRDKQLTVYF